MKKYNESKTKVSDLKIAYIGGGSRGWAYILMKDLAQEPDLSGCVNLYDIDFEAACCNEIIGNRLSARVDVVGKWKYEAKKTLQDALTDADFVFISIPIFPYNDNRKTPHPYATFFFFPFTF